MEYATKRTTVYLNPALHRALRLKALETDQSMSELIQEAIRLSLAEDAADFTAYDERKDEPGVAYEDMLKALRANGRL
jgi:hypothetical protein